MGTSLLAYTAEQIRSYQKELEIVASLSNLFSNSKTPMIYYRATEDIYCRSFYATNVSRTDCTADAIFDTTNGVGIKTFLNKTNGSFQKIAEFDRQKPLYDNLNGLNLIKKVCELRNDRIDATMRTYGLTHMIYHCIARNEDGTIEVFEEKMQRVYIDGIRDYRAKSNTLIFTDGIENYEFNTSKSTLLKRFISVNPFLTFKVDILEDPMAILSQLPQFFKTNQDMASAGRKPSYPSLVIPLYSESKKKGRFVAKRSGLNQWNANGRARNQNEIYIPFPKHLRNQNAGFFPSRYVPWDLKLPDGKTISMAVCQQDGKALMSNPNKDLGKWILRVVLKIRPGELVTYDTLLSVGIDSVVFRKHPDGTYDCDFIVNNDESREDDHDNQS